MAVLRLLPRGTEATEEEVGKTCKKHKSIHDQFMETGKFGVGQEQFVKLMTEQELENLARNFEENKTAKGLMGKQIIFFII